MLGVHSAEMPVLSDNPAPLNDQEESQARRLKNQIKLKLIAHAAFSILFEYKN